MLFRLIALTLLLSTEVVSGVDIVTSVKPIHSLISNLTEGLSEPTLLFDGSRSAHHSHFKPSQLSAINRADLLVLNHPNFETGLAKIFARTDARKKMLIDEGIGNNHVWLDVEKMQQFAQKLTQKLIAIDPANQAVYQQNLANLIQSLSTLRLGVWERLKPYQKRVIASYDNAFDGFIDANQLQKSTNVARYHGDRLSLFKAAHSRKIFKKTQTNCLLFTADTAKKHIRILTEDLPIRSTSIDIIGADIAKGSKHYFKLMKGISEQVVECLK